MCTLEEAFRTFCLAGRKDVDCRGFIRLCRECHLTRDACPDSEMESIFQRSMSVSKRRLDFKRFEGALQLVAERIGVSVKDVQKSVVENSSPTSSVQDSQRKRRGSRHRSEEPSASELCHQRAPEEKRGRQAKEDTNQSNPRASSASPAVLYKPSSCPFISFPKHVQSIASDDLPHKSTRQSSGDTISSSCMSSLNEVQEAVPASAEAQGKFISLEQCFASFCKSSADGMDSKSFCRLCKRSCIIDKAFPLRDCMLTYSSAVPLDQKYMDFESFRAALRMIATSKGLEDEHVERMVTSSQEPHASSDAICDGEEEIVAPPPTPAHSNFGSPKFRRAQSLTSLTGSTSASSLRGEDRALLQKRRSNLFTSMPLIPAMSRNLPPSPSLDSAEGDPSNNDESVGSGLFQAGNSQIRKKCFTSMPLTFVVQSSPQLASRRRSSDGGLQHSSSAPMLEPMTAKNMSFNDHCLQHAIWPSMPLCPVVRAH